MKIFAVIIIFLSFVLLISCEHDKIQLPTIPTGEEQFSNVGEAVFVQISPVLDASLGAEYAFNNPSDIFFGADNLIYVCDTGNNRIVMMDAGGAIQGISQTIPHPEAISQNDSLELLIVNKTNSVYKIDLVQYGHNIASAPIEVVYSQQSEPSRQFTGISVHKGFEYYLTVIDTADSSLNTQAFSFIYDFNANHTLKGPLPLFVNGTGLYSAIIPTGIVSLRERYLDISSLEVTPAFYFCQKGETSLLRNNFKVQGTTTTIIEGTEVMIPNISLIGTELYGVGQYYFPEDITIDRSGFIFVVERGRPLNDPDTTKALPGFFRFAPSGIKLQEVRGLGNGVGQFNEPKGVAVLPFPIEQVTFISDSGNNRILMFKLSTDF
jgi:hypothetical protein